MIHEGHEVTRNLSGLTHYASRITPSFWRDVVALAFLALFAGKSASKIFGLFPVIGRFREDRKERWYYTLLMSTGLTFGSISALYGLSHGIVTQGQYSFLVAVVIASAVVPTIIAGVAFLPRHLLPKAEAPQEAAANGLSEEG